MKLLVIGKGNIGMDLAALSPGSRIFTRSDGFEWPEHMHWIEGFKPTHIFITAGAGSVNEGKANFPAMIQTHLSLPLDLARLMPKETKLCFFSTDYVADPWQPDKPYEQINEPKSLYAMSKLWMEQALLHMDRPNTAIVRVTSVYGHHFPERGLPGKLRFRNPDPCRIDLPQNWITPTPSWWIAKILLNNMDQLFTKKTVIHHCAPKGGVTVAVFGSKVLGPNYTVMSKGFDNERPSQSRLGCTLTDPPSWEDLWNSHEAKAKEKESS